jgi:hypothetical protein
VEDVPAAMPQDLGDLTGKTVCFTGESACTVGGLPMSRPTQEILAMNVGLHVRTLDGRRGSDAIRTLSCRRA